MEHGGSRRFLEDPVTRGPSNPLRERAADDQDPRPAPQGRVHHADPETEEAPPRASPDGLRRGRAGPRKRGATVRPNAFIRELAKSSADVIRTVTVPGDRVAPETFCTELFNAVRLTPSAGGRGRCQHGCRFCPQCDPGPRSLSDAWVSGDGARDAEGIKPDGHRNEEGIPTMHSDANTPTVHRGVGARCPAAIRRHRNRRIERPSRAARQQRRPSHSESKGADRGRTPSPRAQRGVSATPEGTRHRPRSCCR